jgi:hypothetical protein
VVSAFAKGSTRHLLISLFGRVQSFSICALLPLSLLGVLQRLEIFVPDGSFSYLLRGPHFFATTHCL